MKKIYNFRSKIVHGEKLKESEQYADVNGCKVFVPKMAVDFLRYVLIFRIENPEYLEVFKIDSYIDEVIGDSMNMIISHRKYQS